MIQAIRAHSLPNRKVSKLSFIQTFEYTGQKNFEISVKSHDFGQTRIEFLFLVLFKIP